MFNVIKRVLSLILLIIMLASLVVSCGLAGGVKDTIESNKNSNSSASHNTNSNTNSSTNSSTNSNTGSTESGNTDTENVPSTDEVLAEVLSMGTSVPVSEEIDDYIGDLEVFTYGLLINSMEGLYDTFTAYVTLSTGLEVYGLAYTNYSEQYVSTEDGTTYISVGFLPLVGELEISQEEFDSGLIVNDVMYDDEDGKYQFVLTYASDPFSEHCVVFDNYLVYGINEQGQIYYESTPYVRGECNEELGTLYSYDEERVVYDVDFGEYTPLTGESLSESIDFDAIAAELDSVIDTQDINLIDFDVETEIYLAHQAVDSYLLSLQEEMFLGFKVEDLIYASSQLDPSTCLRINEYGIVDVEISEEPPETPTAAVKWLVGSVCVIAAVTATVLTVVPPTAPLAPLWGSISGASIEIFMQVVIENHTLENFQWGRVALSAATGALSGYLGPILQNSLSGAAYFVVDTLVDGVTGGVEYAAYAWMDGENGKEIARQFGKGLAYGLAFSGGFKIAGEALKGLAKGVPALAKKIAPKLTAKVSAMTGAIAAVVGNTINEAKDKLVKKLDDLETARIQKQLIKNAKNAINANAIADAQEALGKRANKLRKRMLDRTINRLSKLDVYDVATNKIVHFDSPAAKKAFYKNAPDGIVSAIIDGDNVAYIVKSGGVVSLVGDPKKYQSVLADIVPDRYSKDGGNLVRAAGQFRDKWLKNMDEIPEDIKDALLKKHQGKALKEILEDIKATEMLDIIEGSKWTLHELADLKTVQLLPKELHGKIAHFGGYKYAVTLYSMLGEKGYKKFLNAASSMIKPD